MTTYKKYHRDMIGARSLIEVKEMHFNCADRLFDLHLQGKLNDEEYEEMNERLFIDYVDKFNDLSEQLADIAETYED